MSEEVGAVGLFLQGVFIKPLNQPLPSGSQSCEDGQSETGSGGLMTTDHRSTEGCGAAEEVPSEEAPRGSRSWVEA